MGQGSWLKSYAYDVFSQTGEDGILIKILETIGDNNRWCVEFGAWDGVHLSNTCNLIRNCGYSAVLIEADKNKFLDLQRSHAENKNVFPLNAFVGNAGPNCLDFLLQKTSIPVNFDVLSIDIDGNDYHVWKAVSKYHPKVVCIEYNPTIPTEVAFVQRSEPQISHGASLLSLVRLGKEKGYELAAVTHLNAIFVHNKYFPLLNIANNSPFELRTDSSDITYIITGYDGRTIIRGSGSLPWHGIVYRESKMQQLPRFLRKYPGNYSFWQRILFKLFFSLRKRNII